MKPTPPRQSITTSAYLRAIRGSSTSGSIDRSDVVRAADGLGRQGAHDQAVDRVERGSLHAIGRNLGVEDAVLYAIDAMAAGIDGAKIPVSDSPQKPERLPEFFDFDSMHELASSGMGAGAVLFNDQHGNCLEIVEQKEDTFVARFLKRPEELPPDAGVKEILAAFAAASPSTMELTNDFAAFLADKIVAMTFRETGSETFDPETYNHDLRDAVSRALAAPGDATPDWVDFRATHGTGYSHTDLGVVHSFNLDGGTAFIRADGPMVEVAYQRGDQDDESRLDYRRISEGEAQRIRDAIDLRNVSSRLWTRFFGGTQLLRRLAP